VSVSSVAPDATTTTAVPRIVGEPLPEGVVIGSGLALFLVIAAAGLWARSRRSPEDRDNRASRADWT
jgi:hypothetical protein